MLQAAARLARGQQPLPRLPAELPAGPAARALSAPPRGGPVAHGVAGDARRGRRLRQRARVPAGPASRRRAAGARGVAGDRRCDGVPDRRRPESSRPGAVARRGATRTLAARERGRSSGRRERISARDGRRRDGGRRDRRPTGAAIAHGGRCPVRRDRQVWRRSLVAAPREMLEDTIGFFRIQPMQRLPLPLRFTGPWRPSKLIEFYMPVILFGGFGSWLLATATSRVPRRRRPSRSRRWRSSAPATCAHAPTSSTSCRWRRRSRRCSLGPRRRSAARAGGSRCSYRSP